MIRTPLNDPELQKHLDSLVPDDIRIFTLGSIEGPAGGELRGAIVNGTRMVSQMRANHGLGILETLLLGKAYLGSALIGAMLKGDDRIILKMECLGAAEGFSTEARAVPGQDGKATAVAVRGRIFNSHIDLETPLESFDTAPFVGLGRLTLTRFIAGHSHPVTGTVNLETGRLAADLAVYFLESEQTHTAFRLSVQFDKKGRVAGAGGLYLQAMPNALPGTLTHAETRLAAMPTLGAWFAQGGDPENLIDHYFSLLGPKHLAKLKVSFSCGCSKDRIQSFLESATVDFLEELTVKGPWPVETVCHNCNTMYAFDRPEIEAFLSAKKIPQSSTPSP